MPWLLLQGGDCSVNGLVRGGCPTKPKRALLGQESSFAISPVLKQHFFVCVWAGVHMPGSCRVRSEDKLQELVLSFHHVCF